MKIDKKYRGKTISETMNIYAPPTENNTRYYIEFINKKTGIDTSRKVDDLSDSDYEKFMGAIREYESSGPDKGKGTIIENNDYKNEIFNKKSTNDQQGNLMNNPSNASNIFISNQMHTHRNSKSGSTILTGPSSDELTEEEKQERRLWALYPTMRPKAT